MRVLVNGEVREAPQGLSLAGALARWEIDSRKVAVELNRAIVPRSTFGDRTLADGDELEIVQFVGGG
ncbi:MAG: sulfur carrier protein ThiS [Hyphomonadaceae bacterium]|nr:sulfur carrier protein ThiS [Hyphomonadaceae bacterium]